MGRVDGKVAIVTGGTKGIGRAAAILLAKEGAKVAVIGRDEKAGEEVVEEIRKNGGTAKFWRLDVTNEQEIERVFREIAEEFGRIDVLVNNAGISGTNKPTHELTEEEWDRVMAVNAKGVFLCTKHVIPYMIKTGGGSIINVSSDAGLIGSGGLVPPQYHASKGAVRIMTKNDALLYAKYNIRVNAIYPGFIRTPMIEKYPPEVQAYLDSLHPLGHMGEPDDVAYGILYLASDESKFVTGSELVIDGGLSAGIFPRR